MNLLTAVPHLLRCLRRITRAFLSSVYLVFGTLLVTRPVTSGAYLLVALSAMSAGT